MPVLYLAPWVDIGGSDKGTIDWFRFLDRNRFAPSLITTQPSPNRRLPEVGAYAEEVWDLPQLMRGDDFPRFILAFIESRSTRLVHVMNSRLAFELLPVIATMPESPRVVVQLHVEEPDRLGYVRYVATRYGNLVDAFSVSSHALSERLAAYDVPRAKRRVIPTGVDAALEFNPARTAPIEGLDRERLQIVFPARLTGQKDPLLMVEVAARLRARDVDFQIHVLGDGDLREPVRARVASLGLDREVVMHGDSLEMPRWYASCDVALLTSRFEGLPYVAYEAMAMGIPIVTPRLPGLEELVTPTTGVLVGSRDADSFAQRIAALAARPEDRRRIGEAARARVVSSFSLERMGEGHGDLYAGLLAERRERPGARARTLVGSEGARANGSRAPRPPQARFRNRRPGSQPLVSVIMPCFNHGQYLPECLASVSRQLYPRIEKIVVDDGSTDPETVTALEEIERAGTASVIRLPANRGPGAARNAGVRRANGDYILPLDADNLLMENAIGDVVEQLNSAGEQVGYIYPNLQFFGNRQDYLEAPSFNLHALLVENFCDTASMIDREVFDRGLRYSDDPGLIHEDWEFVLRLAERGIFGQPARKPTVLVRKGAFTRSDLVDLTACLDDVAGRHRRLFGARARIKAEWSPALSVIALDPLPGDGEALSNLTATAMRQTCSDFEIVLATAEEIWPTELGPRLRRIPTELMSNRAEMLAQGVKLARGNFLLATYGSIATLLVDRAIVEKLLRVFDAEPNLAAVALADAGEGDRPLRLLDPSETDRAILGSLCWRANAPDSPPREAPVIPGSELEMLAATMACRALVQCRHFPRREIRAPTAERPQLQTPTASPDAVSITLGEPRRLRRGNARLRTGPPLLPRCSPAIAATLGAPRPWTPPQTRVLCRHLHRRSGRYTYTHSEASPNDCTSPHVLGVVRGLPLRGTIAILHGPEGDLRFGARVSLDDPALLGFVEEFDFPMLDRLSVGRHPGTGQRVLAAGRSDPLAATLEDLTTVGFIEPYPIHPKDAPHVQAYWRSTGLVRSVDPKLRRHRYAAGSVSSGEFAGELGALLSHPYLESDPLWIDDQGFVFPAGEPLSNGRPSVADALGWTAAPLTWTNFSRLGPKLRASARRAYDSTRVLAGGPAYRERPELPAGYLLRSPTRHTVPLYGAIHPVTGDQLLSTDPSEADALGYRSPGLLGHLLAHAPVTGRLGPIPAVAPWAARFGVRVA